MKKNIPYIVLVLSILHFCVDFICAGSIIFSYTYGSIFIVFPIFGVDYDLFSLSLGIIFYNAFAFLLQPIFGLLVDKWKNKFNKSQKLFVLISIIIIIIGFLINFRNINDNILSFSLPEYISGSIVLGIGNALFHASAGKQVLRLTNLSTPGGLFVSTGALGIGLATIIPFILTKVYVYYLFYGTFFIIILSLLLYITLDLYPRNIKYKTYSFDSFKIFIFVVLLICLAVAIRSFLGFYNKMSKDISTWETILLLSFATFIGKALGGILLDIAGPYFVVGVSTTLSVILSIFLNNIFVDYIYVLSFNLLMPVTLDMLRRCFKNKEGFAFGLAASFLFPGYMLGSLLKPYGLKEVIIPLICLYTGVIIISSYLIIKKNNNKIWKEQ